MAVLTWVLWPVTPILALPAGILAYLAVLLLTQAFNGDERAKLLSIAPARLRGPLSRWLRPREDTPAKS